MLTNAAIFTCSICGEASLNICAYCTKDACANHQCARCKRCSDCCECEVPLSADEPVLEGPAAAMELAPADERGVGIFADETLSDQTLSDQTLAGEMPVGETFASEALADQSQAPEQVEVRPGEPILSPEEASVFVFEKREAIEIQKPDFPRDGEKGE